MRSNEIREFSIDGRKGYLSARVLKRRQCHNLGNDDRPRGNCGRAGSVGGRKLTRRYG
jgi:hypothetical protein